MIDWEFHEDDVDFGRQMPTRRPLSRPQSARMYRHVDAMQCGAALRQITVDQDASLKHAQRRRDGLCTEAQQSMRLQNELRAMHVEVFKESQRQCLEDRAERYYADDMRRTQDWAATVRERHLDHAEAMAEKADLRESHNEMNRQTLKSCQRHRTSFEQARASQARSNALQQRADLLEALRAQLGRTRERKAEQMQAFEEASQLRMERQRLAELGREIQRTEGRVAQLQRGKMGWRVACSYRETSHTEQLIDEKLDAEAERLAHLVADFRDAHAAQPRARQRPKSANAISGRPMTSGIAAFSEAPRQREGFQFDATSLGPRVSVVDPKLGIV